MNTNFERTHFSNICGPYPISSLLYSLVRMNKELFSYVRVILEVEVYTKITRFRLNVESIRFPVTQWTGTPIDVTRYNTGNAATGPRIHDHRAWTSLEPTTEVCRFASQIYDINLINFTARSNILTPTLLQVHLHKSEI
jgi:hypothetical protein